MGYKSISFNKQDCDLLRTIASVMVVVAHCIHPWVEEFSQTKSFLSLGALSGILDQLTRFTVPLFLFVSGIGLTVQYAKKNFTALEYYKKRLPRILFPFILWSLLTSTRHIGYFATLNWSDSFFNSLGSVLNFLFLTGFDYQYYFLIVLFQFYLIFPLLYKLRQSHYLLAFCFIIQFLTFAPIETYLYFGNLTLPPIYHNLLSYYLGYCFMGMYLVANPNTWHSILSKLNRKSSLLIWIGVFSLLIFEFFWNIVSVNKSLSDSDHFNRWTVVLYCFSTLLLFIKWQPVLKKYYKKGVLYFIITHMAPFTYFVYLSHTHFLRMIEYTLSPSNTFSMIFRIFTVLLLSYSCGWMMQYILQKFPKTRFCFSLPWKYSHFKVHIPMVPSLKKA